MIFDLKTEVIVLQSMLDTTNAKAKSELVSNVREDHFYAAQTAEAYQRILKLWKANRRPTWDNILSDITISAKTRDRLDAISLKTHPVNTEKDAIELFDSLDNYRKARVLHDMGQLLSERFSGDTKSLDPDKIAEELANELSKVKKAGVSSKQNDEFSDLIVKKLISDMRKGNKDRVIPTGLKEFDKLNGGVLRGTNMSIGAYTGEGKSQLAQCIAMQMAMMGYRVCFMSFEMPEKMVWTRALALLSGISVTALEMRLISEQKYDFAEDCYTVFQRCVRRMGGCFRVEHPAIRPTMMQMLAQLEPYAYDVIVVDYLSLMAGMGGDDFWRRIGDAASQAQDYAINTDSVTITVFQTDKEGEARLSKMIADNSGLMFTWKPPEKIKNKQTQQSNEKSDLEKKEIDFFDVNMPKSRMQKAFTMRLYRSKGHMQVSSDVKDLQKPWVYKCQYVEEEFKKLNAKMLTKHRRHNKVRPSQITEARRKKRSKMSFRLRG